MQLPLKTIEFLSLHWHLLFFQIRFDMQTHWEPLTAPVMFEELQGMQTLLT
jgi:hypothetical protein